MPSFIIVGYMRKVLGRPPHVVTVNDDHMKPRFKRKVRG